MINKRLIPLIIGLSFLIGNSSFAQAESRSSSSEEKIILVQWRGYTLDLKQLLKKAEEGIKKVEKEIRQERVGEQNVETEKKIREHFEKGNEFYKQQKLKKAKEEWEKIITLSKHPEMKDYIEKSARRVEIEQLFTQVDNLCKKQNYEACQPLLDKILKLDEGNQKAEKLCTDLPEKIAQKEKERSLEK